MWQLIWAEHLEFSDKSESSDSSVPIGVQSLLYTLMLTVLHSQMEFKNIFRIGTPSTVLREMQK